MKDSIFTIYSASAGSGKTYTLTKNYLKLLFEDNSLSKFRQILALTFTNKAVGEMKSRILESLYNFSKTEILDSDDSLFQDLCLETGSSPEELHRKSRVLLKHILHNYSFFDVSTIDKFNHRILKTFARDLQLSQNFEVELDTDSLLEKAVDRLLDRAGSDKELTQTLLAFSLEKIDDNKSWNIAYDLIDMGKVLFQENHAVHLEKLKKKSISSFNTLKTELQKEIKKCDELAVNRGEEVLKKIVSEGFSFEDFPRQTLPNHFKKIIAGDHSLKRLYGNTLEEQLSENKFLKANDSRDTLSLSEYLLNEFIQIRKLLYRRAYLSNIYGNIVPMTLLNEISKEIKHIEAEEDLIPISDLNQIISKEIKGQPVPFIYERLGEKYRNYFIDEFQDTSQVQWENLIPLISNALEGENEQSQSGSLFLVGDVKQAIYRWRGGKAEQFLNLLNGSTNPFTIKPDIELLDTNWRSASEIVSFNNAFFSLVAPLLHNGEYKQLYLKDNNQKHNSKIGGYINLTVVSNDRAIKDDEHCDAVLNAINEILSKKYTFSDISVLVRENKKGSLLANYLSENNIPVISPDSLLLGNHPSIQFLVALLTFLGNPSDRPAKFEILHFLALDKDKLHDFVNSHIEDLSDFFLKNYNFSTKLYQKKTVSEIVEATIISFDLAEGSEAYLTFFTDVVMEVEKKVGLDILSFLDFWNEKKEKLSLSAPEEVNAVKVMTIHKAKGLEFPFVIFPFANSPITNRRSKKAWVVSAKDEKSWGMDEFLMNFSQEMEHYNENSASVFVEEEEKTQMDALNLLYVALTRAKTGLFVVTETSKPNLDPHMLTTYSELFAYYLQHKGIWDPEKNQYVFGSIKENALSGTEELKSMHIPYIIRSTEKMGQTISTKSGQLWGTEAEKAIEIGNVVHSVLGKIRYSGDASKVLLEIESRGDLPKEILGKTKEIVLKTISHPLLEEYFSPLYTIYNERELLTKDGKVLRPDRVAIADGTATIIDYKTGKPDARYQSQMESYSDEIKSMGFSIKNSIIVYIEEEVNPLFLFT
nr:UvrD-helicase domain-containing protein [Allomuricauda sp.]